MDVCECGFDFEGTDLSEIPDRAGRGVDEICRLLGKEPSAADSRPSDQRWSNVEYAAHVRDVFLTIRDRIVIGLVEDNPGFKSLYRDERVDLGLYRADTADDIVYELQAAQAMFVRLFTALPHEALERPVQYGWPKPTTRTLSWMGLQAVHESEHHLADIKENLRQLAS